MWASDRLGASCKMPELGWSGAQEMGVKREGGGQVGNSTSDRKRQGREAVDAVAGRKTGIRRSLGAGSWDLQSWGVRGAAAGQWPRTRWISVIQRPLRKSTSRSIALVQTPAVSPAELLGLSQNKSDGPETTGLLGGFFPASPASRDSAPSCWCSR